MTPGLRKTSPGKYGTFIMTVSFPISPIRPVIRGRKPGGPSLIMRSSAGSTSRVIIPA